MKPYICCKTTSKGIQSYYVVVGGAHLFLFEQKFRKSNKEYFSGGITIDKAMHFAGAHSFSVRKTLSKLPAHLRYIEKEYDITILNKTKQKKRRKEEKFDRSNHWGYCGEPV